MSHPVQCRRDPAGAASRIQHPGAPRGQHVDEPGLALQVGAVGVLPGEPVDVEVPALTGHGWFPTGRVGVHWSGWHLRMMARRVGPTRAVRAQSTGDTVTPLPVAAVRRRRHARVPFHPTGSRRRVCRDRAVLPVAAAGSRNGHGRLTLPTDGMAPRYRRRSALDDPSDLPAAINHCRTLSISMPIRSRSMPCWRPIQHLPLRWPHARSPGTRAVDGPEILVRAMLGQQVSVAGAQTAATRLVLAADHRLPAPDGELTHLLPTPAAIAALGPGPSPVPTPRAGHLRRGGRDGRRIVDRRPPTGRPLR